MVALGASLILAACGGDGSNPPPPPPASSVGAVSGTVSSAVDSSPIAGAIVSNGAARATTGADGTFSLADVAVSPRTVVRISATGFGEGLQVTSVVADTTSTIAAQLYPVGASTTASAATAINLTVPGSPASVSLPANGLVRADGTPATGNVTVALTPVDPALDVNSMPGEYRVATSPTTTGLMESWGAINVTLQDEAGERLNLGAGKTATIRIPVATRNPVIPATIPLFYFNEEIGLWEEEGSATLAGTAPDQYYEGTVTHFSYWNADMLMDTVFVNGCVADEGTGMPAANAVVTIDGINYSNASSARSGTDGKFRIPMKKNGTGILSALQGSKLSNTVSLGGSDTDITLDACLQLATMADSIAIKLTWGELPLDVDSHLFAPDGTHVYYSDEGSLTTDPFANLDVDDTDSFGPEVVTLRKLMVGTYTYAVHNYSETYAPGMTASPVRVELNRGGVITAFSPPAGEVSEATDWWTVFELEVDDRCEVTVNRVNSWGSSEPAPAPVVRKYCTAP